MKRSNSKLVIGWTAVLFGVAVVTGCGGDTYVRVQGTTTVSKGQELIDLKKAFDEGAINRDEYDRVRAIILKRQH